MSRLLIFFILLAAGIPSGGCARLFGWQIYAPGTLSARALENLPSRPERVALYIPAGQQTVVSTDRGTWLSDPQTYHVGEAFIPMLLEVFQAGFSEFILMQAEPTPERMRRYGIENLVVVEILDFINRKRYGSQGLDLVTQTTVFDESLTMVSRFRTSASSDAREVFARKGGPEVNLNRAIESNLLALMHALRDVLSAAQAGEREKA